MKNRILFLVRERTGSTLLTSCLLAQNGCFWGPNNPKSFKTIEFPTWIKTIPKKQMSFWWNGHKSVNIFNEKINIPDPKLSHHESYMWNPPAKLQPSFYQQLSGNWKFVYLTRDPRNRAESITKRGESGYLEESEERVNFRKLLLFNELNSYNVELQSISKMLNYPNFYLLKFEDMIKNPLAVFEDIIKFCGCVIDKDFYKKHIDKQISEYTNTSFNDNGQKSNERWKNWTKTEKEKALEIIGEQLIFFGYEKDDNWSKE